MSALTEPRRFTSDTATGASHNHGAHVVEWTPAGHLPVLWLSTASYHDSDKPIRGGIPVCFPWFGAGRSGDLAPAHGFARVRPWITRGTEYSSAGARVTYELLTEGQPEFPHPVAAVLMVTFGRELHLELSVTNMGSTPLSFEEALHTYLAVGDIHGVSVHGLDGAPYIDKAPGAPTSPVVQDGAITFTGETDRVYSSSADVVLEDPSLRRRITVRRTGSANAVVWNPWIAKAAAMPDFGDDEWTGMVCIEGANVLDDAIDLQPGATHVMGYTVQVEHLD